MSQATTAGERMCQGTFFAKISSSKCKKTWAVFNPAKEVWKAGNRKKAIRTCQKNFKKIKPAIILFRHISENNNKNRWNIGEKRKILWQKKKEIFMKK